ncbi:hypothetical protein PCA31118_04666 [Pandoraea captiosa]|uniref:Uncharacterized protein n=1 Tax=Pandoraea captiosa TaxID=2508302 RepID=A0A5E5ALT0_9BURK|nr:hypothetical protein [Pandoraea captiosa]VVE74036.1 hypothetical protein PCA31118_04666 [Pandoraea captiosa]
MATDEKPGAVRRFWDMTINVQSLAMALVGGILSIAIAYAGVVSRVDKLEAREQGQDDRMGRIEQTQIQQKADTNQQLRDISSDVKDVRNLLMNNAAGARTDMKRWAR